MYSSIWKKQEITIDKSISEICELKNLKDIKYVYKM